MRYWADGTSGGAARLESGGYQHNENFGRNIINVDGFGVWWEELAWK